MSDVDTYIAAIANAEHRHIVEQTREIALLLSPEGVESISYGMPVIKEDGEAVFGYAPNKSHLGLYPHSGNIVPLVLQQYSDLKGTPGALHVPYDDPRLAVLIGVLIELRREEIAQRSR